MGKMVAPGIEKLGRQYYRLWWTETLTGTRRSKRMRGITLDQAKDEIEEISQSQRRGTYVLPASTTLRGYLDEWMRRRELAARVCERTLRRDRDRVSAVCRTPVGGRELGDWPVQELTRAAIEAAYEWMLTCETTSAGRKLSRSTVNRRHVTLSQALGDATELDPPLIARNPAAKAVHPGVDKPHAEAWTLEEAQAVMAAVQGWPYGAAVCFDMNTGMRVGELCGVRRRDVKFTDEGGECAIAGQVVDVKGSGPTWVPYGKTSRSRRVISFGPDTAALIKEHLRGQAEMRLSLGVAWEDSGMVFCAPHGQIMDPKRLSRLFTPVVRAMEEHGMLSTSSGTFHTMRHTHATLLLRAGVPVHMVSSRLGHSVQVCLNHYGHVIPMDDAKTASLFETMMASEFDAESHADVTVHRNRARTGTPCPQERLRASAL